MQKWFVAVWCLAAACSTPQSAERPKKRVPDEVPDVPQPPPRPAAPRPPPLPTTLDGVEPAQLMRLHVLDIGQGTALLLEFPCGAMLVDTGGELNDSFDGVAALQRQLDAFFARRDDLQRTLDVVVLTHPHLDHVRGVPMVLERFVVKNLVDNGHPGDELVREPLEPWWRRVETDPAHHRSVGESVDVPMGGLQDAVIDPIACQPVDPRIRVLAGGHSSDPGWGSDHSRSNFHNENNHSVVVRVDFGAASVLVTGDLEVPAIRTLVDKYRGTGLLDVDVYVVGHHGSANGTTVELVDEMTPTVAVMSMGPPSRHARWTGWQYGHPRQVIVDMLLDAPLARRMPVDVPVASGQRRFADMRMERAMFGTGWDGAITVELAEDGRMAVGSGGGGPQDHR